MEVRPITGSGSSGSSFNGVYGSGTSSPIVVNHELGTEAVDVTVREAGGSKLAVDISWGVTDADTITLYPDVVVALDSIHVLVRS